MTVKLLDFALGLAERVWGAIKEAGGRSDAAEIVGFTEMDVTRMVDRIAEDEGVKHVREEGLDVLFIGEESPPLRIGSEPGVAVILDPLDGSTNFVRGIPFSSISVALASLGNGGGAVEPFIGVVKDIARGDVYYAEKGKGAFLNGSRLYRSNVDIRDKPLVSLYTYGPSGGEETALHTIRLNDHCNLRTMGSMALELCYLASSRLDGVVDIRGMLRLQDIAAGKLIVEEAGCIIADGDGRPLNLKVNHRYSIVAADSKERLKWLLSLLE